MERFQVLSLDGGGIRGAFIAAFLAELESRSQTKIVDHFDLIVGTSTGGIIAIGLGMGLPAKEILRFYKDNGPKIFPGLLPAWFRRLPLAGLLEPRNYRSIVRRKFNNVPLQNSLISAFPTDSLLGHSAKRLVISSYDMQRNSVKLFKTAHHERFKSDYLIPAWQIALATSAAPTFFQATRTANRFLVDGGLWANDPVMVGVTEAIGVLQKSPAHIKVLSIGTLNEVSALSRFQLGGGKLIWAKPAIDSMMNGQSTGAQGQAQLLLGKNNVLRVSPPIPAGHYKLDDASCVEELVGIASGEAEHRSPEIQDMFFDHHSTPFNPIYEISARA